MGKQMGFFGKIIAKITGSTHASTSDWNELEAALLAADFGPELSREVVAAAHSLRADDATQAITAALTAFLSNKSREMSKAVSGPTVLLIVGVNGTGKTTSAAKLAASFIAQDASVLLAAADTFRAAAVDQLRTWGERLDVDVVHGADNADPASVAFDAAQQGLARNIDYLIIDTAGRLHTKSDLMSELGKVKRVVEKVLPIQEVLLVIDATTGQNGLIQAKIFAESVDVTGVIVTKLDGTARGGIALAIERSLNIPIKWVGTGEGAGDFAPFDPTSYIQGLL
ncbi:MAG TPA: signal recognition particle-docking protein FtsY [Candidatus Nanopelagicaceae bacterium]|nr:signal recognition particle-docking protein FtsY [Candidatus Nanopelagicaceae bacterium]